jgi:hypothetical protein
MNIPLSLDGVKYPSNRDISLKVATLALASITHTNSRKASKKPVW